MAPLINGGMTRKIVLALVVFAVIALTAVHLSKGERMAPPPASMLSVDVRPISR